MSVDLSAFGEEVRVAIFGASGGIGAAMADLLNETENISRIHSFSRSGQRKVGDKETHHKFDLTDEASIEKAAELVGSDVQIVIVASGMLHNEETDIQPEKTIRNLELGKAIRSYEVNTIGPLLIAKHFLPLLPREEKSCFAALSARVGSISDNKIGGWYSYRASKAALNQMIRCAAIELARKNKNATCITLHPGTVDTDLSKPFQANVSQSKLFEKKYSASHLLSVINKTPPSDSGQMIAYDGSIIAP